MKGKKAIISALSVSALALSLGGVASAEEMSAAPASSIQNASHSPIKVMDAFYQMKVNSYLNIARDGATSYVVTSGRDYISVSQSGMVYSKSIPGSAQVTIYKGSSVLGVVTISVRQ
ncbi:hypothetical protein [Bacillus vallismortis]|uniref:hypothetical protein n=1 Tax=Bacillus vallismortis TaxID=72361 RepID=UPI000EF55010|nr:hypothetical protein [Bacillus vallismortis]